MMETVDKRGGLGLRRWFGRRLARRAGRMSLSPDQPRQIQRAYLDKAGERLPDAPGVRVEAVEFAGRPALRFVPEDPRPGALLYLHGGGYSRGSPASHRPLVSRLSRTFALEAIALSYRLAPEHVCPAAVEDGFDALSRLRDETAGPLLLAGDSAGGGLALASALRQRSAGGAAPEALYLLSPWTDLSLSGESVKTRASVDPMLTPEALQAGAALYLDGRDPRDPQASPLFADLAGLPPTFIQVGDDEVLLDDSIRLHDRLEAAGVTAQCEVWRAMWHDFQMFAPVVTEADEALHRARDWLAPHLSAAQA